LDKVKMEDVGHGKKKRMEEGKRRGMGKWIGLIRCRLNWWMILLGVFIFNHSLSLSDSSFLLK
jgi:hypothetical protein